MKSERLLVCLQYSFIHRHLYPAVSSLSTGGRCEAGAETNRNLLVHLYDPFNSFK